MTKTFVTLDLETTGLEPDRDAIIEVGAIKFKGERVEAEFSTLVNPGRKLTPFITRLTGITDAMLVNAPRLPAVLPKLTPAAQKHFDAYAAATKEGKVYRDDIGQCWPAGMPIIMTRVWPIAMIQMPTAIYMISEFMNSMRVIYLDGRQHTDPDVVVRTFNGESIGRWEGDTLVIDTRHFTDLDKHWVDQGIPASKDFRMIERYRLINNGNTLEIEYTFEDPKTFEGTWKTTKRWQRTVDRDIAEVSCLPDLNDHMPSTRSNDNVR